MPERSEIKSDSEAQLTDVIRNRIAAAGLTGLALIAVAILLGTSIERSPTPDHILYVKMWCRSDTERDCLISFPIVDDFPEVPKVREVRAPKPPTVSAPEFEVSAPKPGDK